MIDTGYGVYDIRAYAENLIGRTIPWAASTHGHFDHTGGNGLFEQTFMTAACDKAARIPYPSFKGWKLCRFDYPSVIVSDGYIIDLGGRTLEVITIPAHDTGSAAFLDKQERLLFVGDEVKEHVPLMWQRKDAQPTIEQYVSNKEKLMARRGEFDHICPGHGDKWLDASYVDKCLACARQILAGNIEGEALKHLPQDDPPLPPEALKNKKGPRPGDLIIYDPEFKRIAEYGGVSIQYDIRYRFNPK
jgi:glyoxylase-like metal-dependent hydrolase (beta-lactamase superfamily II)